MKKLSLFLDSVFILFGSFILSFCILRIFNAPKFISTLSSLIFAVCIFTAYFLKKYEYHYKKFASIFQSKKLNALRFKLSIMKNDEIIDLFGNVFKNYTKNKFYIENEKNLIIFNFLYDDLSVNDGLAVLKNIKTEKQIIFISNGFSLPLQKILTSLNVNTISIENVFLFFKENNAKFLDDLKIENIKKFNVERIFFRKNGVRFIIYGIFLELLSLLTFFPIYYVLSGSIFIIYGLIALFFGKTHKKSNVSLSDII